ncbi:MAG: choice-of-anchor D domain-containing protein [Terracidiphilus sp.]
MRTLSAVVVCVAILSLAGHCYAQTELVSDDFSGANGTFLGSNWTGCGYNNGAYNELVYENDEAGGSGYWAQDCALYTGYGAFPSDQYVTATVVAPTPSSTPQASIQLRANATPYTNEAYIACGWDAQDFPADHHYRIWSLAPGSSGPVSLWLSTITPATNDVISCQVLGNTVSMNLNGRLVETVTDTSGINSGYPGLYYVDPNGTGPSSTDVIFANFQAGSGPSVVSTTITPQAATVPAGSFVQYNGTITYANGSVATTNNWSSSNNSVATVDVTGTAYGTGPGTAMLTGSSGPDSVTSTMNVEVPNGYTPLGYDTFVGTGGGYLGSNWTGCGFDSGSYSKLVYQNNQAGGSGYWSQDCALFTGIGIFPNDQYATALVVAQSPSLTPEASIELRGNTNPGTPESYIACGWDAQDFPSDQHYRIWSLAPNGTPTSLYLSTISPIKNDVIWCQVLGSEITMQVNGTTVAVVNDTSGLTSGYPGMFYIDPNGGVPGVGDVIFDDFAAGQINNPVLASIMVSPTSSTTLVNSSVQFTATGTYTDGTVSNVTNSLSWLSSNTSVATVNSNGLATGVGPGTATITDTNGTVSGTSSLTVNQLTPTVTFTGAPASAAYNTSFTVTATTNATTMPQIAGTSGICTVGTVGGTPANSSALVTMSSGTGTCTLTATWAADAKYMSPSPRTQRTSAVKVASTTTIASHTPNPSTLRQAVTVSFSAAGTGAGPTGSVTVTASTGESCTGTLSSHSGSCSITFVTSGTRTLTARYGGDNNFNTSTSTGVSQTVNSPTVKLSPTSLNFGTVTRGSSATLAETVSNTGTGALINLSWTFTGSSASKFTVSSTTCGTAPATLNAGASCVINVAFKPTTTGAQTATLSLTDNAANSPQSVGLTGTGR